MRASKACSSKQSRRNPSSTIRWRSILRAWFRRSPDRKRPQDRINLPDVGKNFTESMLGAAVKTAEIGTNGSRATIHDGSVVIAAITSCTNTSNPSVLVAAGLLAKKAVERGLKSQPWVKTSLAPGSKVVMDYLADAGLIPYLRR
jgi:aconitate hydratase